MINPEFQRQLWLELNPARVITLAVALGALFALMRLIDARSGLDAATPMAAMIAFVGLAVAWGGSRAGESVGEELRARTWDTQRLSALSPWAMTWGKWAGATSYVWLGGAACLVVFLLTARHLAPANRGLFALQALGGALLVQGVSLIGALTLAGHPRRAKGSLRGSYGTKLIAVASGLGYAWLIFKLSAAETLLWYGHAYPALLFCTVLLWFVVGWVVLGAYRMMCDALQTPRSPWAWGGFLASMTVIGAGWYVHDGLSSLAQLRLGAAVALLVTLSATYLAAFTVYRDPLALRRLSHYLVARQWRRAAATLPLWLVSLVLALVVALLCVLLAGSPTLSAQPIENLGLRALALWLFAARDLLLLLGVTFALREERAEMTAVLYFALLYWLLPALAGSVGLTSLRDAIRPALWEQPGVAVLTLVIHVVVAGAWTWQRYRTRVAPQPPIN